MFSETISYRWVGSILVERLFPTGALCLSRDGHREIYMGYSQKDALARFRREHPARAN